MITEDGYFLHKYNPDGSPASSWHPWVLKGNAAMPIQEDETALVVWALWRHYFRYRDIEFIRPLWVDVVQKAADFMARYRDPRTGLPLPSYDLWEERWGVHAFTVATVYGGLKAARNFAVCFGDRQKRKFTTTPPNRSRCRRQISVERQAAALQSAGWFRATIRCRRITPIMRRRRGCTRIRARKISSKSMK